MTGKHKGWLRYVTVMWQRCDLRFVTAKFSLQHFTVNASLSECVLCAYTYPLSFQPLQTFLIIYLTPAKVAVCDITGLFKGSYILCFIKTCISSQYRNTKSFWFVHANCQLSADPAPWVSPSSKLLRVPVPERSLLFCSLCFHTLSSIVSHLTNSLAFTLLFSFSISL